MGKNTGWHTKKQKNLSFSNRMYTKFNLSYIVVPLCERGGGRDVGEIFKGWLSFGIKKVQGLVGNLYQWSFWKSWFLSLLQPRVEGLGVVSKSVKHTIFQIS